MPHSKQHWSLQEFTLDDQHLDRIHTQSGFLIDHRSHTLAHFAQSSKALILQRAITSFTPLSYLVLTSFIPHFLQTLPQVLSIYSKEHPLLATIMESLRFDFTWVQAIVTNLFPKSFDCWPTDRLNPSIW